MAPRTHASARRVVQQYIAEREQWRTRFFDARPGDPWARRMGKALVPQSMRLRVRLAATSALRPRERRRARELTRRTPGLRLHLGSGPNRKSGWVNVDLAGDPVDIAWNVAQPLPFPDRTAQVVFSEHLLEYLSVAEGLRLLEECRRILAPGGIVRIGVPDARRYAVSYVDDPHGFLEAIRPGRPTPLLAMQEIFYHPGHRTMYDAETLILLMTAAGFEQVEEKAFGDSRVRPCPDTPARMPVSVYAEGSRPET